MFLNTYGYFEMGVAHEDRGQHRWWLPGKPIPAICSRYLHVIRNEDAFTIFNYPFCETSSAMSLLLSGRLVFMHIHESFTFENMYFLFVQVWDFIWNACLATLPSGSVFSAINKDRVIAIILGTWVSQLSKVPDSITVAWCAFELFYVKYFLHSRFHLANKTAKLSPVHGRTQILCRT